MLGEYLGHRKLGESLVRSKLALNGGEPAVSKSLVAHDWERFRKGTPEEIEAVTRVLESGHLSIAGSLGMPQADALEKEFCEWTGAKYCLVVNSGTAALHCAVAGLGIGAGDEVLVPAYTFVASAMAVLHQNAIPVFVDVDPETYLMDPNRVEKRITDRTKAIMVVHILGLPGDMNEINRIAKKYNLKVIEDSAQSYGAYYGDKMTGTLADAAGFAMTTTKHLMTGEGGLFTTNSSDVYERAAMTRLFGEPGDMKALDRAYMSERIGWNYKLPEMTSALARVRLRHLKDYVSGCQKNAEQLSEKLDGIPGLVLPKVPAGRTHAWYLYSLQVDPQALAMDIEAGKLRDSVMLALQAENVDVMRWQKVPVPAQPLFQNKQGYGNGCPWAHAKPVSYNIYDYPNTINIMERSFGLRRLAPPNSSELVDAYAIAVKKVFSNIEEAVSCFDTTNTYIPVAARMAALAGNP